MTVRINAVLSVTHYINIKKKMETFIIVPFIEGAVLCCYRFSESKHGKTA